MFILYACNTAFAEAGCPPNISPDNPIRTITNSTVPIALDFEVLYKIEPLNNVYKIPVGYSWANVKTNSTPKMWSNITTDARIVNKTEGSGFWFWMPSMRYVERNMVVTTSFYPCEDGRPLATEEQEEYVVHAIITEPEKMADGTELIPSQMVTNMLSTYHGKENLSLKKEYGLVRFESKQYPNPSVKRYHYIDGTSPQAMMYCTLDTPNKNCHGYFYFPDTKFYVTMHFPTSKLPHWKEILKSTQILLDKWRVKNPEEITKYLDEQKNAPRGEE